MNTQQIMQSWTQTVKGWLPETHLYQVRALAACSLGMALARHCQARQIANRIAVASTPASQERRLQRLLANARLDVGVQTRQIAAHLLQDWVGSRIVLMIDETPEHEVLRCLKVSVAYQGRAIPLVFMAYPPDAPPQPMPALVEAVLSTVAALLPQGAEILLMADRGLCWPLLVDLCQAFGWHPLLRAQGQTRLLLPSGEEVTLSSLAPRPGRQRLASGQVFKDAGGRTLNVVARWEPDREEPWLLLTDLPASYHYCVWYSKRMWQEEAFRDEKSQGFQWQLSRVRDPVHTMRLLLCMMLAQLWMLCLGKKVQAGGERHCFDPRREWHLSLFQLGLSCLQWALTQDAYLSCQLNLPPPDNSLT
jgi:hypothetical protein